MDNQDLNVLQTLLKSIIKRIEFFLPKIKSIAVNSDEMQYYEWFLVRNFLDFEKITEILDIKHKIKKDWNINNPFSIWAEYLDRLKHQDKENRMFSNFKDKFNIAIQKTKKHGSALFNINELFFDDKQDSYQFQDHKQQLIDCFVTPLLLNNNLKNINEEIDIAYNKWNDIKMFFIFLFNNISNIEKHKNELWNWFESNLPNTNKKILKNKDI